MVVLFSKNSNFNETLTFGKLKYKKKQMQLAKLPLISISVPIPPLIDPIIFLEEECGVRLCLCVRCFKKKKLPKIRPTSFFLFVFVLSIPHWKGRVNFFWEIKKQYEKFNEKFKCLWLCVFQQALLRWMVIDRSMGKKQKDPRIKHSWIRNS